MSENAAMPYEPSEAADRSSPLARFKRLYLDRRGVEGVGLGADDAGEPVIVVYVSSDAGSASIPSSFEGRAVRTVAVGRIVAR